jgi:hypothetical protein
LEEGGALLGKILKIRRKCEKREKEKGIRK